MSLAEPGLGDQQKSEDVAAPATDTLEPGDVPYPGLRAFRRDETHIFFGREGTVNLMVDRLGAHRFLAVTGASGSGKSSLVKTGLLDALERGLLASAGPAWRIADFRPGGRPLLALTDHVVAAIERESTADERAIVDARLARGPLGLVDWLDQIQYERDTNLLLLVDQFEELFRFRERVSDEAQAFVALLLASAEQRRRPIYVVITMRSDFLGDCSLFPGLAEAVNDGQFLTPRLTREQCAAAIEGPAEVYGGRVEKALSTQMLNDMGSNPDQLPLMQHVLMLMWERASGKAGGAAPLLTLKDYEALGGIGSPATGGALSEHADAVLLGLTVEQQRLAAVLFRSLVLSEGNIGRDVRRPISLGEAADIAAVSPEALKPVIEAFRAPRRNFLMPPPPMPLEPDTIIDISHESLIRQWRTLRKWVKEEFQSRENYQRFEKNAELKREGKAGLLTDPELGVALNWRQTEKPNAAWAARYGGDFALTLRFLDSSERQATFRRWRLFATIGCLVLAALGVALVWGINQQRAAQAATMEAEKQAAAAKAAKAQLALLNFANELSDFRVSPRTDLQTDANLNTPTPLTIPGDARVLTTTQLYELLRTNPSALLIDALWGPHEMGLPGAWRLPSAGRGGAFDDNTQKDLELRLARLTGEDLNRTLVFFCIGAVCWESYNAALRAEKLGYKHIYWYRGGINAWKASASVLSEGEKPSSDEAGRAAPSVAANKEAPLTRSPDVDRNPQSISQYSKSLIANLDRANAGPNDRWNVSYALSNAADVLLGLDRPDAAGAKEASEAAVSILKALWATHPTDANLAKDYAQALSVHAHALQTGGDPKGGLADYDTADKVCGAILARDPDNKDFLETESKILDSERELDQNMKEWTQAIDIQKEQLQIDDKLAKLHPENDDYIFAHSKDLLVHGMLNRKLGNYDLSSDDFRLAMIEYTRLNYSIDNDNLRARLNQCWRASNLVSIVSDVRQKSYYILACINLLKDQDLGSDLDGDYARKYLRWGASQLNDVADEFVLARDFKAAEHTARVARAVAPQDIYTDGALAQTLMFQGKTAEARDIYVKDHDANGWIWDKEILKDFAQLRSHGLTDPLMDEIEKLYQDSK
jgi:PQQ-dependent catabolism-associated CXXCW motif protein